MQDLIEVDWSFVFVIVSVTLLMATLGVRSRILKRQRKRAEKREARRQYKEWLAASTPRPGPDERGDDKA